MTHIGLMAHPSLHNEGVTTDPEDALVSQGTFQSVMAFNGVGIQNPAVEERNETASDGTREPVLTESAADDRRQTPGGRPWTGSKNRACTKQSRHHSSLNQT